jgi:membrane glycosyltransferase
MFVLSPGFFYWLSPVAVGLAVSVPLAVLTGREGLGRALRGLRLFRTPAGTFPAAEIRDLANGYRRGRPPGPLPIPESSGFVRAVALPGTLALHLMVSVHDRGSFPAKARRLDEAVRKALEEGPGALSQKEKRLLLSDRGSLLRLHKAVWELPQESSRKWGIG